jgi:hypothetical protein
VPWNWTGENEAVIEYTNSEIEAVIDEVVHNARDRAILKRRFIDGVCFEPLAEEFSLSVRHVKRIVYRETERISAKLR